MSARKGKKKNKQVGSEPNVLVNTSALYSYQSPADSIACLTEMFGEKIEIDVIRLVLSECDNDVNQAAESLSSLIDNDCHSTRDDSLFQENQSLSSISESAEELEAFLHPKVQNLSSEKLFCPNSLTKSFASSLNCKSNLGSTNLANPDSSTNSLSSPFKIFSSENSYLSSSSLKNQTNKVVDKKSVVVDHICTIINTLKYDELKNYLPGYFHSQKCDRIFSNINLGLPVLIILRGLPGSGKSTIASALKCNGVVYSTDDYFYQKGVYKFVPSSLPEAHEWNQLRAKEALVNNVSPIIIDNTNLMVWEMSYYVSAGLKHNYIVEIIEPATSWKFKPSELSKRNVHGVSRKGIEDMLTRYQNADSVCHALKRNKFATVFVCPFSDWKGGNKLVSKSSNGGDKFNVSSETRRLESIPIPKSCHTPTGKEKEFNTQNQPNNVSILKFGLVPQDNSYPFNCSKKIQANSLKKQKGKTKCINETSKDNSKPKSSFNPLIKHATTKQGPLWEHMKCLQLGVEEELCLSAVECANNSFPYCNLNVNDNLNDSCDLKPTADELKCSIGEPKNISEICTEVDECDPDPEISTKVDECDPDPKISTEVDECDPDPKISTEVDKCDPDSSESEISVDVRSESETNYSQSVSSWVTSSEDISESESSERPDAENISSFIKNFREETEKRLNNRKDFNPVFPKPPRNKPISSPLGNQLSINRIKSNKPNDLEIFSESWDSWGANSSDGEQTSIDNPKPKPRRETWKQIEESSLAFLSLDNKRDVPPVVELRKQESGPIPEPCSLQILEKPTEPEKNEIFHSFNLTEKCVGGDRELPKPVALSNQNLLVQSPSKLNQQDAPTSSTESSKYIKTDREFPSPCSVTPQLSSSHERFPKRRNRQPLIIGADKYLGKNWGFPDCLTSDSINPEIIVETASQTISSMQISSETQTESKDFMFIDQMRKKHASPEELKESVYKIVFANLRHSVHNEKENLSKELKEELFCPRSNNQFDASTSTEDYSADIADDQKLLYIKECFPDFTEKELEIYLGLCHGDVHWAINIIIENGHVSQKSKTELGIAEEKSLLNSAFKSISLESIPASAILSPPEISPFEKSKNWYSDDVLFKTPITTRTYISADNNKLEGGETCVDVKPETSEDSSEEDFLKSSDKIILTLSLEDAQKLQIQYGLVVENKALSTPANREIALDPELVYSLWMSTQSLKESNTDICQRHQKKEKSEKGKSRRSLFPETLSDSKKIPSDPQTLSEIMDMEYALKLDEEEKLKKDTNFIKEKRLELYSVYPGMDRRYLDAVFDSNNYNVEESKFCIDGTYAMIENDSKTAAASPIASGIRRKSKYKTDSEEAQNYLSNGSQKSHLGIAPNHFLNWVSPGVLPPDNKFSPSIENSSPKNTIQRNHDLAQSELASKREMSAKAVKAYHSKMMGVAAYYAEKAREHHWNANEHFNAICESIKADSKTYELDLHGCYVREGMKLLRQFLNHHEQRLKNWPEKDYPRLSIITGFGKHSENGPVLQPSVSRFLRENKYLFSTNKFYSMFYVTLKRDEENGKRK